MLKEMRRLHIEYVFNCRYIDSFSSPISEPAWRSKPSWYIVAVDDQMIPAAAQRLMAKRAGATVVESPGSHAVYISQAKAVADLIKRAATGVSRQAA